jgi:hypothetical protein
MGLVDTGQILADGAVLRRIEDVIPLLPHFSRAARAP